MEIVNSGYEFMGPGFANDDAMSGFYRIKNRRVKSPDIRNWKRRSEAL
jgi:hypothetical protein